MKQLALEFSYAVPAARDTDDAASKVRIAFVRGKFRRVEPPMPSLEPLKAKLGIDFSGLSFDDRRRLLGDAGEREFAKIGAEKGFVCYAPPVDEDFAPVDLVAIQRAGEFRAEFVQVKTQSAMATGETGISTSLLARYRLFCATNRARLVLAFVDPRLGVVYGAYLDRLGPGRLITGRTGARVIWPASSMRGIADISPDRAAYLRALSTARALHNERAGV